MWPMHTAVWYCGTVIVSCLAAKLLSWITSLASTTQVRVLDEKSARAHLNPHMKHLAEFIIRIRPHLHKTE